MANRHTHRLKETDSDVEVLKDTIFGTDLLDLRNTFLDQPQGDTKAGLHMGLTVFLGDRVIEFQGANTFRSVNVRKVESEWICYQREP